jgi:hypothetical protein
MRKIWVFLLAAAAFAVGAVGAMGFIGYSGSLTGMRIACELLDTAEAKNIFTRQQRTDVVERVEQTMRKYSPSDKAGAESFGQMMKGCPIQQRR